MIYKVAICDDSEADIAYVRSLTLLWADMRGFSLHIDTFSSAEQFLFHYDQARDYDILLLDVEMGQLDGVHLAQRVRQENDMVQIVFVTGYSDYISQGYEVAALHYLVKPVKQEKLLSVLDRAAEKLQKNERFLTVSSAGETVRIPLRYIRYLDVHLNYVTIHAKQDHLLKKPLAELQPLLDEQFYRIGRSCIVNLSQISRVTKTQIVLLDGTALPLPRGAYEGVNRAIINMR